LEEDAGEKTAKAILGDEVSSEPASHAATDATEGVTSVEDAATAKEGALDSGARQKLAHMKVEPLEIKQVNQEEPEKTQTAPVDGPSSKHGGGTLKAVVEDLGPPKAKDGP
jgi:hypothetical protein